MLVATQQLQTQVKKCRALSFTLMVGLLTVALMAVGGAEYLDAWILRNPSMDIHLWHVAELVALAVMLLGGTLISLLWRPQTKPLLAQFFILSIAILALGVMPFQIKAGGLFLVDAVFIAVYPDFRALLSMKREGPVSKSLIALSLVMGVALAPTAWRELQWQIIGMTTDIHAELYHWIGSVLLMVLLVVAGLLTATKRPGWKELGFITGGVYLYMGLTAMMVPFYTGSWGAAAGLFTIIAGIWYMLIVLLEAQRAYHKVQAPVAQTAEMQEVVTAPVFEPVFALETLPVRTSQKLCDTIEVHTTQKLAAALDTLPARNTRQLVGAH